MARRLSRSLAPVVPLVLITSLVACARATRDERASLPAPGELHITEDQIVESGATTAWDAIKRNAPQIDLSENRSGQPSRMKRRGRSSIYLNDTPLVFIDGVKVLDFRNLDLVPASTIFSILIISGIDGATYYGTNAGNGVILIRTKPD